MRFEQVRETPLAGSRHHPGVHAYCVPGSFLEDVVIPTLLVLGLVVGTLIHDRVSLWRSVAAGTTVSVLWGVVVGVAEVSAATAAGGAALGLANVLVGAAVGAAARAIWGVARVAGDRNPAAPR